MELPTREVFVRNHQEPAIINESDFDAKVHRAVEDGSWEDAAKKAETPKEPKPPAPPKESKKAKDADKTTKPDTGKQTEETKEPEQTNS